MKLDRRLVVALYLFVSDEALLVLLLKGMGMEALILLSYLLLSLLSSESAH